jgi:Ca-activated chloride channel family protein
MFGTFAWHSPWYLVLLALLPFIFFFDLRKRRLLRFASSTGTSFQASGKSWRQRFEFLPILLRTTALALLIVALARPQLSNKITDVQSEGVDIVLALDTSGSMQALDLELQGQRADRLSVVKSVVKDFIASRQYDRIGMVVFGDEAYTQCPLTLDYDILRSYLDLIEIGIAGEGTAIGNGIATAVKRLENSKAKSQVIVLLTDGRSNAGQVSPMAAAELAKKRGIKIYTISVGTKGNVPFPQDTPFGKKIAYVQLDTDDETLKQIATTTGGQFFSASSTEMLTQVYDTIGKLEKSKVEVKEFTEYQELYEEPLYAAIALLLIAWFLRQRVFVRVP